MTPRNVHFKRLPRDSARQPSLTLLTQLPTLNDSLWMHVCSKMFWKNQDIAVIQQQHWESARSSHRLRCPTLMLLSVVIKDSFTRLAYRLLPFPHEASTPRSPSGGGRFVQTLPTAKAAWQTEVAPAPCSGYPHRLHGILHLPVSKGCLRQLTVRSGLFVAGRWAFIFLFFLTFEHLLYFPPVKLVI